MRKLTFALFTTIQIVSAILIYQLFARSHQKQFDAALYNHAIDVSQGVDPNAFGGLSVKGDLLSAGGKILPFAANSAYLQILNTDGRVIARSGGLDRDRLPLFLDDWKAINGEGVAFRTLEKKDLPVAHHFPYRLVSYLVRNSFVGGKSFILQVAVPMTSFEDTISSLLKLLLIAVPLSLFAALMLTSPRTMGALIKKY